MNAAPISGVVLKHQSSFAFIIKKVFFFVMLMGKCFGP